MTDTVEVFQYLDGRLTLLQEPSSELRYWVLESLKRLRDMLEPDFDDLRVPADAVDYVLDNYQFCWAGSFLIAYDVCDTWMFTNPIIAEEFVVSFGSTPPQMVTDALEALGKHYQARRVFIGTRSLGDRQEALSRLRQRAGYRVSTIELVKELQNG